MSTGRAKMRIIVFSTSGKSICSNRPCWTLLAEMGLFSGEAPSVTGRNVNDRQIFGTASRKTWQQREARLALLGLHSLFIVLR